MALRLIRQGSDTPNITNHDDARMARYAYGGYDGYIKGVGDEIGHETNGANFIVKSGVIVLQGWEVEIDANGVTIAASASVAEKEYYSVYLEVNCATDSAEIKSSTGRTGFPEVASGDDLTANTIGTARLLLYHFTATSGAIADVVKMVQGIEYAGAVVEKLIEELEDGTVKPANSQKVNDLEIMRDTSGVLKIGDVIIPQKRLIWEGNAAIGDEFFDVNTHGGAHIQAEIKMNISSFTEQQSTYAEFRLPSKSQLDNWENAMSHMDYWPLATTSFGKESEFDEPRIMIPNLIIQKNKKLLFKSVFMITYNTGDSLTTNNITNDQTGTFVTINKLYRIIE